MNIIQNYLRFVGCLTVKKISVRFHCHISILNISDTQNSHYLSTDNRWTITYLQKKLELQRKKKIVIASLVSIKIQLYYLIWSQVQ